MPKMKTHSGTKKRIKVTGSGRLRRERTNKRHLLEGKSSRRTRRLSVDADVSPGDTKQVLRLLGKR
jgi:large subunit ribosomal protein L35